MKLKQLLEALHEDIKLSSTQEIADACSLIIEVQDFDSGMRDCIRAAFYNGPIDDGDVPSKSSRDALIATGFITRVVVKGKDGYNACTQKGAWANRLIELMVNTN